VPFRASLASAPPTLKAGTWFHLRLSASGALISVLLLSVSLAVRFLSRMVDVSLFALLTYLGRGLGTCTRLRILPSVRSGRACGGGMVAALDADVVAALQA